MGKAELGTKRRCLSCAVSFFDLNRSPVVCPKCGAAFQIVEYARSRPKWSPSFPVANKRPGADPIVAESAEPEPEPAEDEDEENVIPANDDDDNELDEDVKAEDDGAVDV